MYNRLTDVLLDEPFPPIFRHDEVDLFSPFIFNPSTVCRDDLTRKLHEAYIFHDEYETSLMKGSLPMQQDGSWRDIKLMDRPPYHCRVLLKEFGPGSGLAGPFPDFPWFNCEGTLGDLADGLCEELRKLVKKGAKTAEAQTSGSLESANDIAVHRSSAKERSEIHDDSETSRNLESDEASNSEELPEIEEACENAQMSTTKRQRRLMRPP